MTRTERRGVFNALQPAERMDVWYRRNPFSVRTKWLNPRHPYIESVYQENADDGHVRLTVNRRVAPLLPGTLRIKPQTAVTWGEARYSIDQFGVERLMQTTLQSIEEVSGRAKISYLEQRAVGQPPVQAHVIRIVYPRPAGESDTQDILVDAATHIPLGTILTFSDGKLDASYIYEQINPSVRLEDKDFQLSAERGS